MKKIFEWVKLDSKRNVFIYSKDTFYYFEFTEGQYHCRHSFFHGINSERLDKCVEAWLRAFKVWIEAQGEENGPNSQSSFRSS